MAFDRAKFLELAQRGAMPQSDELEDLDEDVKPYSSLAREGAPEPDLSLDKAGDQRSRDEYESDPAMRRFDADQAKLASLEEAQRGASKLDTLAAAGQQIALGASKPVLSDAILKNSQRQDEQLLKSQQDTIKTRARVMSAIEARKQREAMEKDRSEARDLVARDRQQELGLKREERQEKRANELRTPFGEANTAEDAKKLKDAYESKQDFDSKIQEMIALREKYGGGAMPWNRDDIARGKQLSKDLLLRYKDMAKLGVLSVSDEKILNQIIPPDPLALSLVPGQDPVMAKLKSFKKDSDRDFETRVATRVKPGQMPAPAAPAPQAGSSPMDAKIESFMKKNGIADKGEAIRILKENGKI